ncbi:methyltransferase [Microlunatus soli]|uniref:O-methyltransferase n=1 Tax=Microlunatus soli TaxID=630515 RepID=A0A1H1W4R6_9ACTN|nr:methyltransferase [Microlunatus soli]SDS91199.1 O-methyltransferase [Microlunatus soli]
MGAETTLAGLADLMTPVALRAAVAIGLFEAVGERAVPLPVLAAELDVDVAALDRLVRFLRARDLLRIDADGNVLLTAVSEPLGRPGNWSARLNWAGAAGHLDRRFVEDLLPMLRAGRTDRDIWAELAADPALDASFDELMNTRADEWIDAVAASDSWSAYDRVLDLGGGRGHLVAALLTARPRLRGAVIERPGPAAAARTRLASYGERVEVVVGDLREPLPVTSTGPDAYVLAHILHDWDDENARIILSRAAAAAGSSGRVVVIERVLGGGADELREATHQDLRLFVLFGGRERTRQEFADLGAAAGLRLLDDTATATNRHLLTFALT